MTIPPSVADFAIAIEIFQTLKDLSIERQQRILRWIFEGLGWTVPLFPSLSPTTPPQVTPATPPPSPISGCGSEKERHLMNERATSLLQKLIELLHTEGVAGFRNVAHAIAVALAKHPKFVGRVPFVLRMIPRVYYTMAITTTDEVTRAAMHDALDPHFMERAERIIGELEVNICGTGTRMIPATVGGGTEGASGERAPSDDVSHDAKWEPRPGPSGESTPSVDLSGSAEKSHESVRQFSVEALSAKEDRPCPYCGLRFSPSRRSQHYCSDECHEAAVELRKMGIEDLVDVIHPEAWKGQPSFYSDNLDPDAIK